MKPDPDNNQQSIEVGGKFPFKLKGRNGFVWALVLGLLVLVGFFIRFNLGLWGDPFPIKQALTDHAAKVKGEHDSYVERADEATYVMSVCLNPQRQKECEQINLQMPDSLRKKQR